MKFVSGWVKNIVGKGENAGFHHFLLFPRCFSKSFILSVVQSRDCMVKGLIKALDFLPNDNIFDLTKLKAFTDNNINVTILFFTE